MASDSYSANLELDLRLAPAFPLGDDHNDGFDVLLYEAIPLTIVYECVLGEST